MAAAGRLVSPRASARLAAAVCALALALDLVTALLFVRLGPNEQLSPQDLAVAVTFPAVGLLIVSRRGNLVGWLMVLAGLTTTAQVVTSEYGFYTLRAHPGALPAGIWVLWVSNWVWVPGVVILFVLLPLVFPTGRLPSRRWRPVAGLAGLLLGLLTFLAMFAGGPLNGEAANPNNPLGIDSLTAARGPLIGVGFLLLLLCGLACAVGLVLRFRRLKGSERAQIEWFAYAVSLTAIALVLSFVAPGQGGLRLAAEAVSSLSLAGIAVAIGVAVLRYRLYDIDRIVSRTVAYALLTGLLVATYVGLVTLATRLVPSSNSVAVAGSTLAVAALFQPLRRRVQSGVDRRFNRARYDAERTVEAFSRRLRGEVDLEAVRTDLLAVVSQTLQPAGVSVWLRRAGS
ncbi:MAG: hypothetical protein NVSMB13_07230 [Mycobacteriales bacterium]